MKIYIGADHHGFSLKSQISQYLETAGHQVIDEGDDKLEPSDDFPVYAASVARALLNDEDKQSKGILLCGSGQGVCMAANRFKGIRASICWDENEARSSRNDDDANVLCLSADKFDLETIKDLMDIWLSTPFGNQDRYSRRIQELDKLG